MTLLERVTELSIEELKKLAEEERQWENDGVLYSESLIIKLCKDWYPNSLWVSVAPRIFQEIYRLLWEDSKKEVEMLQDEIDYLLTF